MPGGGPEADYGGQPQDGERGERDAGGHEAGTAAGTEAAGRGQAWDHGGGYSRDQG